MPAHSKRTPEMVEAILEGMSKGQTLTSLCAGQGISVQTWHDWRYADEALNIAHGRARETGFDYVARIHVRSRSGSMAETKGIQAQIYNRLHRGALTITGFNHILIQRENSQVMTAPDNQFHGVCEYRGLMEKT